MKILKICGKNLASLAGEFEVDFQSEPLVSSGLFAISGPTGAGKSTLLDALCLALYDATPRLLKASSRGIGLPDVRDEVVTPQDTRTLLRRGAAEAHAEVDFIGSDGIAYRARWSVRRSRNKADGALQNISMSLKQLPELQPIGGTYREVKAEIERRIGLSFGQFTRAVLLAQNEFSAFLKADDGERGELLETLTGTAIYSDISKRAYERFKSEEQALKQMNLRLADQKPLDQEARAQLEQELAQADDAAKLLEQRKSLLDAHLRWHQSWEQVRAGEQKAQAELTRLEAEQQAAADRRAHFTRIEAVQPARQLLHDCDRISSEIATGKQAILDNEAKLASAIETTRNADVALTDASRTLQEAEQAQAAAQPLLDSAKALDAQIDTLLPAHRQAENALEQLRQAERDAQQALRKNDEDRERALVAQRDAISWLEQNAHLQTLAESWPRWETLFTQANRIVGEQARLEADLTRLRAEESQKKKRAEQAVLDLAHAQEAMATADAQRQERAVRVAAFDLASLHARKQATDARRETLTSAEQLWRQHAGNISLHAELGTRLATLRKDEAGAQAQQKHINEQLPGANAALAQAERALRLAEAATGENVEALRASLHEGDPCPVCGSPHHPYSNEDPKWRGLLDGLRNEVTQCQMRVRELLQQLATQTTLAAQSRKQSATIAQQLGEIEAQIKSSQLACDTHPIAAELGEADTADRLAWIAAQQQALREQSATITREEQAAQQASLLRDKAQQQYDAAIRKQQTLKEAETTAAAALNACIAACASGAEKCADASQRLDNTLEELDAAFGTSPWREAWRRDPEEFHLRRKDDVNQWHVRRALRDEQAVQIGKLDAARQALTESVAKAGADVTRASQAHAASAALLNDKTAARKALFEGKAVEQVQAELGQAIELAKARVATQTEIRQQCLSAEVRLREAIVQTQQRQALQEQALRNADEALASWMTKFNEAVTTDESPLDPTELRALLAHTPQWIADERRQLQELDNALQNARTVLGERQLQRQTVEQQRPTPDEVDAVKDALVRLAEEREQASAQSAALRLSLAADDGRREKSAAMMDEVSKQEARTRLWAQLNELIGSADGKKFRNFAQQFTLDVLLGYANHHLFELARRYRLQRIPDTLALMVVDQDMGEELRSVHSLSGGESFLVSLALALALASLSSNRVRVESLFIDEGFGSLDADTLSVAMDALDGLQAMGRKVGVISHVQEMTERIATKIMVQRVSGGRSVVQVNVG